MRIKNSINFKGIDNSNINTNVFAKIMGNKPFDSKINTHTDTYSVQTSDTDTKKEKSKFKKYVTIGVAAIVGMATSIIIIKKGRVNNSKYKLEQVDTIWTRDLGKTTTDAMKKIFNDAFVEPLTKGEVPKNGFLVQGPETASKKQFFEWCIEQMKQVGVEIVDTTDSKLGYSTKDALYEIFNLIHPKSAQKFKLDGKYRLFVARGMEKNGHIRATEKILKDVTHDCAENRGLILAYECLDRNNFYHSVTRPGRIDHSFVPMPLETEDLSRWKEFLEFIKMRESPVWITKYIQEAREIFTKKGSDTLKEMEPYLKYNAPYKIPNEKVSLEVWKEYITKSSEMLTPIQHFNEAAYVVLVMGNDCQNGIMTQKYYQSIVDMIMASIPEQSKSKMQEVVDIALKQRA